MNKIKRMEDISVDVNVIIVTVYNSLNSGSFLQATSLYKVIEQMGYEVSFLDTGARNIKRQAFTEMIYMLKKCDFKSALCKVKMARKLSSELDKFSVVNAKDVGCGMDTIFVLGSDEIWNVARDNMASFPIFWGIGLNLSRCISYAPSVNNATKDDFDRYEFVKEALNGIKSISARDSYSKNLLEGYSQREVELVCDPTLLMPIEYYYEKMSRVDEEGYILLYVYSKSLTREYIDAIRKFASKSKKKIIAFGSNFRWADKNVSGSPWDFLAYINNADYVITSTFHGTLFSTVFNKQFVVIGDKNQKVREFLDVVKLNRMAAPDQLENILLSRVDKEKTKAILEKMQERGLFYLKNSLSNI